MDDMTDEEYDALDELMTKTTPRLGTKPGIITRQRMLLDALDEVTANYIKTKSEELHKIPTIIVADMVREKIANEIGVANL